jgi:hypothetical protein
MSAFDPKRTCYLWCDDSRVFGSALNLWSVLDIDGNGWLATLLPPRMKPNIECRRLELGLSTNI